MALTFDEYAKDAGVTAVYPDRGDNIIYPTLGLTGEAGEVAEKVKKLVRDKGGVVDEEFRQALKKEIGDVMWYVAALAAELGFTLEEIAQANIDKLHSRQARNKLHGEGDDR